MLPKDVPPHSTVQRYFCDWRDGGLLQTIRFTLAMETRELEGREAQPTAGVIRWPTGDASNRREATARR